MNLKDVTIQDLKVWNAGVKVESIEVLLWNHPLCAEIISLDFQVNLLLGAKDLVETLVLFLILNLGISIKSLV
jgi:hypothetical protein